MSQKIRIKLKSFDHNLVDKSAEKIVKTVKATGAVVSGPIPLPTHKRIFTVNRSTFVNKKSREQFELSSYKRLIDTRSQFQLHQCLNGLVVAVVDVDQTLKARQLELLTALLVNEGRAVYSIDALESRQRNWAAHLSTS